MAAELDDTIELAPGVKPQEVEACLIEAVNYGWRVGGNDGRCNVPANFVGWALYKMRELREEVAYWRERAVGQSKPE